MTSIWYKIVGIAVLVGLILGSYWYAVNYGKRIEKTNTIIAVAKANEDATKNFDALWELYIAAEGKEKIRFKTIKKEVVKIVERDVYKNVCMDEEGLAKANEALSGKEK